ncbi:MAG: hypothetical protein OES79_13380 [Planctomycetota bacterium]|nr:hypothetical protein [Planctomycetota bacterium]
MRSVLSAPELLQASSLLQAKTLLQGGSLLQAKTLQARTLLQDALSQVPLLLAKTSDIHQRYLS